MCKETRLEPYQTTTIFDKLKCEFTVVIKILKNISNAYKYDLYALTARTRPLKLVTRQVRKVRWPHGSRVSPGKSEVLLGRKAGLRAH